MPAPAETSATNPEAENVVSSTENKYRQTFAKGLEVMESTTYDALEKYVALLAAQKADTSKNLDQEINQTLKYLREKTNKLKNKPGQAEQRIYNLLLEILKAEDNELRQSIAESILNEAALVNGNGTEISVESTPESTPTVEADQEQIAEVIKELYTEIGPLRQWLRRLDFSKAEPVDATTRQGIARYRELLITMQSAINQLGPERSQALQASFLRYQKTYEGSKLRYERHLPSLVDQISALQEVLITLDLENAEDRLVVLGDQVDAEQSYRKLEFDWRQYRDTLLLPSALNFDQLRQNIEQRLSADREVAACTFLGAITNTEILSQVSVVPQEDKDSFTKELKVQVADFLRAVCNSDQMEDSLLARLQQQGDVELSEQVLSKIIAACEPYHGWPCFTEEEAQALAQELQTLLSKERVQPKSLEIRKRQAMQRLQALYQLVGGKTEAVSVPEPTAVAPAELTVGQVTGFARQDILDLLEKAQVAGDFSQEHLLDILTIIHPEITPVQAA